MGKEPEWWRGWVGQRLFRLICLLQLPPGSHKVSNFEKVSEGKKKKGHVMKAVLYARALRWLFLVLEDLH